MKKLFICLVIAFIAVCANAQITWNVRAGGGVFQHIASDGWESNVESNFSGVLFAQSNIPFKKASPFTFSPSTSVSIAQLENINITLPLLLGYKITLGNKTLFIPKIGAMIGTLFCKEEKALFELGPAIELPLEINHFTTAINASISLVNEEPLFGAYLTFGYKF